MHSGGHLHGLNRPGKTEFPPGWDEDTIGEQIVSVANDPDWATRRDLGIWLAAGTRRGVTIVVYLRPDGSIVAGHPISGPGVRQNPRVRGTHLTGYFAFSELAHATVTKFLDRVPAKHRQGFEYMLIGGEERFAVTDLTVTLVQNQVPVTAAERDDVQRLLEYLKEPADQVDRLNVIPEG